MCEGAQGVRTELDTDTGVCTVTLSRPRRKNAFLRVMYDELVDALAAADADERATIAVITGAGDYFSSGNDLVDAASGDSDPERRARDSAELLTRFTRRLTEVGLPIVALVNGPAVGIACTMLGVCDVVYASDSAYFLTPFARLGQSPEGLSSATFPAMMGFSNANEMLLLGRRMSAAEAKRRNLVSDVFPAATFRADAMKIVLEAAAQPPRTMRRIKQLMRERSRDDMMRTMKAEIDLLQELWQTEECFNAVMKFMMDAQARRQSRSSKL